MGAFVIFDPYWDTVAAFDDEADAKSYVASHPSTHYLWVGDATVTEFGFLDAVPKLWDDDSLLTPHGWQAWQSRQRKASDQPHTESGREVRSSPSSPTPAGDAG